MYNFTTPTRRCRSTVGGQPTALAVVLMSSFFSAAGQGREDLGAGGLAPREDLPAGIGGGSGELFLRNERLLSDCRLLGSTGGESFLVFDRLFLDTAAPAPEVFVRPRFFLP